METLIPLPNGITLCTQSFGDPSDPLIVQVEGHMAQMISTPATYCQQVADHGFHVVRFDNRDVGRSSRTPLPYTLVDMATDLSLLIEHLGKPATVCGRSMGGAIAQLAAIHYPEVVNALGLFYTFANRTTSTAGKTQKSPFSDQHTYTMWLASALQNIAGSAYPWTATDLANLAKAAWERGVDWAGFERQRMAMQTTPAWADKLGQLRLPVTIIHGKEDVVVPYQRGIELHKALVGSQLHIVEGLGHQQPEALNNFFVDATVDLARRAGEKVSCLWR